MRSEVSRRPSGKFALLQVLRGIAALWVVLFHCFSGHHIDGLIASSPTWVHPLFQLGNNGVAIFFVLSGFVIAHSVRGERIAFGYVGRFALRRSIRLDPSYWISILVFVAFANLSAIVKHEQIFWPSIGQLASNMTYTQLFFGYPSINDVYWTLCYEVQFYIVLVMLIMATQRFGRWVNILPFGAAILWGCGFIANPFPGLFLNLWHCFFLGVLAYWAVSSRMAVGAFLLLIVSLMWSTPTIFTQVCIATASGLLLAGRADLLRRGSWAPFLFLGTISYSLYLTHNPVAGAAFFMLSKLGVPELPTLLLALAACILAAWLFWLAVERPTMKLSHRIKLRADDVAHVHHAQLSVFRLPSG